MASFGTSVDKTRDYMADAEYHKSEAEKFRREVDKLTRKNEALTRAVAFHQGKELTQAGCAQGIAETKTVSDSKLNADLLKMVEHLKAELERICGLLEKCQQANVVLINEKVKLKADMLLLTTQTESAMSACAQDKIFKQDRIFVLNKKISENDELIAQQIDIIAKRNSTITNQVKQIATLRRDVNAFEAENTVLKSENVALATENRELSIRLGYTVTE